MAKKTYTVTGSTGYAGHVQGETFEAELSEDQERRALERGSIKVGKQTKKEEKGDA
jgi:hypothetical protein